MLVVNISGIYAATCVYSVNSEIDNYCCELFNATLNDPNGTLAIDGTHVSGKLDNDVVDLKINSATSSIVSVPADILNKFRNLNNLELRSANIETISSNAFNNCNGLQNLVLDRNRISLLPNKVFEKCINLIYLGFYANSITTIEISAFSGLSKLEQLDISYNKITQLEFNFVDLPELIYFSFPNNEVVAVKTDFHTNLKSIQFLYGGSNVCIDETLFISPTSKSVASLLEKCYQNYQDIQKEKAVKLFCKYYLDKDYGYACVISNVTSMLETDVFDISGTHLIGKTDENVNLVLVQSSNFVRIPSEIFTKYPALIYLSLSNVGVATLNENSFKNAKNLKTIWLNRNKITKLPGLLFKETPKLEQLMLIQNQISEINVNAFSGTSNLLRLDMSNNKIQTLESGLLQSLTNLQVLTLLNNEINIIHNDTFKGLTKLKYLTLDGSKIVDVSEEWFTTTTNLKVLSLQNNQINTIGRNVFSKLIFLKELKLENNICVSKNFYNIKLVNVDVIPNISKCINNFNMAKII